VSVCGCYAFNDVGIGGHVQGGGFGMQSRKYGLAGDKTVEISIVLYNGTLLNVSASSHESLFWALRGGGSGSYGIITSFTIRIFQMIENSMFLLTFPLTETIPVFLIWQDYFVKAEEGLNSQIKITDTAITIKGHYLGKMDDLWGHLNASRLADIKGVDILVKSCSGLGSRLFMDKEYFLIK
jgi:FAD/FMN-containing dehydrogenase